MLENKKFFEENPEKGLLQLSVDIENEDKKAHVVAGPYEWYSDFPPPLGGSNTAPTPILQFLGALGSCSVLLIRDVLSPLYECSVDSVKVNITANADARGMFAIKGGNRNVTDIKINVKIKSSENEEKLKKVYDEFLIRCPVYLAIINQNQIKTMLEIQR